MSISAKRPQFRYCSEQVQLGVRVRYWRGRAADAAGQLMLAGAADGGQLLRGLSQCNANYLVQRKAFVGVLGSRIAVHSTPYLPACWGQ